MHLPANRVEFLSLKFEVKKGLGSSICASSMASKPINIRCIKTGYQPY